MARKNFSLDISRFVDKARGNADAVVAKVVLDLGANLIAASPVGNPSLWAGPAPAGYVGGTFRNSWQYHVDTLGAIAKRHADPSGAAAMADLAGVAMPAAGRKHFITNGLPYARALEYGHSRQAPQGMVAITIVRFQETVRAAAATVRSQS